MDEDAGFVSDLNAAVRESAHGGARAMLYVCALSIVLMLWWAKDAQLDEVARGAGKIIPFSKVQVVGNLEGGIVEEILVKTGDRVEKDQPLLKLDNKKSEGSYEENSARFEDLQLRCARLAAEIAGKSFEPPAKLAAAHPEMAASEKALYAANADVLANQQRIDDSQIEQKKLEVTETESRVRNLEESLSLIDQQLALTRPLVQRRIESQVELLKLEREQTGIRERLGSAKDSIPRLQSAIAEIESKKDDLHKSYITRAQKDYSDTLLEINQIEKKQESLKDQVTRTLVRSPVRGVVKQVLVTTVGGVVKPGMDLVEIVPVEDNLLVEVHLRPADIAFLKPGQPATVKITAYDFSIYGGLDGKLVNIGADSQTDDRQQTYFPVWIRTGRNYLGTPDQPLKVFPGMTVTADILTGKKSVLQYLVKPILKAKANALTER